MIVIQSFCFYCNKRYEKYNRYTFYHQKEFSDAVCLMIVKYIFTLYLYLSFLYYLYCCCYELSFNAQKLPFPKILHRELSI